MNSSKSLSVSISDLYSSIISYWSESCFVLRKETSNFLGNLSSITIICLNSSIFSQLIPYLQHNLQRIIRHYTFVIYILFIILFPYFSAVAETSKKFYLFLYYFLQSLFPAPAPFHALFLSILIHVEIENHFHGLNNLQNHCYSQPPF